jgi:hypothetical protein
MTLASQSGLELAQLVCSNDQVCRRRYVADEDTLPCY